MRFVSDIKTPKDFEGKTLGESATDGAQAFSGLLEDRENQIKIFDMQLSMYEQMLMKKQVDGVFDYYNTIRFSPMPIGVNTAKQVHLNKYGDHGTDLYSNSIIISHKLAKEHPQAAKGLIAAMNHGLKDVLKDPMAAIGTVAKRSLLIDKSIEPKRPLAALQVEMNSGGDRQDCAWQYRHCAAEEVGQDSGQRRESAEHAGDKRILHGEIHTAGFGATEKAGQQITSPQTAAPLPGGGLSVHQ